MYLSKNKEALLIAVAKGYRIDEYGNVFSSTNTVVKPHINQNGYKTFSVRLQERKSRGVYFCRLQAYQKYKDKAFEAGIVVRHLNGNPLDDSYENIAIGTHSDNMLDKPKSKRIELATKASQFARVRPDSQLQEIFDDRYKNGFSYKDLLEKYNIAKSTLSFLFNKSLFSKKYAELA